MRRARPSGPRRRRLLLSAAATLVLAACSSPQDVLDPQGPAAARIEDLWWVLFVMGVTVSVGVAVLLLLAIRSSRRRRQGKAARDVNGYALVGIGAGVFTPIVLIALLVYNFKVGTEVYATAETDEEAITIDVLGHQFWWEVRYPQYGVTSANEIHIPVGRTVRFRVTAPDVIHSFWIPQLQGKIDMIPGHTNHIWVRADEPGLFRGQCAEYCGMSHALMAFWVVAVPEEEFAEWVEWRSRPQPEPADAEVRLGREIFFAAGCGKCHATRGAPLPSGLGDVGPDLTHLASRLTLAAGTLPNTRGSLGGWISNPQRIKPGSRMPATHLRAEQLQALLTYLQSLH